MGRKVSTRNSSNSQRNIAVTVPAASTPATKRRNSSLRSQHHHLRASQTDHPAMTGARVVTAVRTMIKGKAAAPAAGQRMGAAATHLLHVTVALHTAAATPMEAA